jgi:hypothetical protein
MESRMEPRPSNLNLHNSDNNLQFIVLEGWRVEEGYRGHEKQCDSGRGDGGQILRQAQTALLLQADPARSNLSCEENALMTSTACSLGLDVRAERPVIRFFLHG